MSTIHRPRRPADAGVSAQTEYVKALETYCTLIESAGRTLQTQNGRMLATLRWYADLDHYDLFGVATERDSAGQPCPDRGMLARAALAALDERNVGVTHER